MVGIKYRLLNNESLIVTSCQAFVVSTFCWLYKCMQDARHRHHDCTGSKGFECSDLSDRVVILDRKAEHDRADQRTGNTDTPCPPTDKQQDILENAVI